MRSWILIATLTSCTFSFHHSLSGESGEAPRASKEPERDPEQGPERAAERAPEPAPERGARPSKRGDVDERPGTPAPVLVGPPAFVLDAKAAGNKAAGAEWNGTYDTTPASCDQVPVFDPKGPDVQSAHASGWAYNPGFRCPGQCTNPATAIKVANGKMSIPLVWVEDRPPEEGDGYRVTMHRYQLDVPLVSERGQEPGNLAKYTTQPFKWSQNNIMNEASDGFAIDVNVKSVKDVHWGTGRIAEITVRPHSPTYKEEGGYLVRSGAGCEIDYVRTDFKPGDGLFESSGGDDDYDPSETASRGGNSSAKRECKSQCMAQAGACRMGCRSGAKCANDCNRTEKSCKKSC